MFAEREGVSRDMLVQAFTRALKKQEPGQIKLALVLSIVISLASCVTIRQAPLVPVTGVMPLHQGLQKISLVQADKSHDFIAALTLSNESIDVVGMSAQGQRLFTALYDGHRLQVVSDFADEIPGRLIIGDILFAYGELDQLAAKMPKNWTLVEKGLVRALTYKEDEIMRITYSSLPRTTSSIHIDHPQIGMQLNITQLNGEED